MNVLELKKLTFSAIMARVKHALGGAKEVAQKGGTSITVNKSELPSDFDLGILHNSGFTTKNKKQLPIIQKFWPKRVVSWDLTDEEFEAFLKEDKLS